MSKVEYVKKVAVMLQCLPLKVTKEELMNHYLHNLKIKTNVEAEITVFNLIQAATLAGKQVKGKSKLEINVSYKEQLRYIREGSGGVVGRKEKMERVFEDKDKIIKAYENGTSSTKLAEVYGVAPATLRSYLKKFGAKMRKVGKPKIEDTITRKTGKGNKSKRRSKAQ